MTWKEIKLATLQKMFAADGSNLIVDESTKDYIASMPQVANEGLQLLSTAGKFIIKSFCIANNPVENLLPDSSSQKICQIMRGTKRFSVSKGHSYYFECIGKGTATIYVGDIASEVIDLDDKQSFKVYKGLIQNDSELSVCVEFDTDYPMSIKNIAIYDANFETVDDVQPYGAKMKYDITKLVPDFYELDSTEVYYEADETAYLQTSNFFQEGNKLFVVDRELAGNFTVYYKAYPPEITTLTEDSYELPIDKEVAVLLPLYMASQLYKDDDMEVSNTYREEFETAFSSLKNKTSVPSAEKFTSESGWI